MIMNYVITFPQGLRHEPLRGWEYQLQQLGNVPKPPSKATVDYVCQD